MKKFIAALALTALAPFASAASLDLPQPGISSGDFSWSGGLGADVDFRAGTSGPYIYDDLRVQGFSGIVFQVEDDYVRGDEFGLVLDGVSKAWDATWTNPDGYFSAIDLELLSAGPHTLDLIVTADCCGSGAGHWKLVSSPVFPGAGGEVPLPAAAWFFLSAIGGLGLIKRRQR